MHRPLHHPVDSLSLSPSAEGTLLSVQAHAGARRNGITGCHNGRLKVAVTQAPERGKANRALIETLANQLQIRKAAVTLVSGETTTHKTFQIQGLSPSQLRERLQQILCAEG